MRSHCSRVIGYAKRVIRLLYHERQQCHRYMCANKPHTPIFGQGSFLSVCVCGEGGGGFEKYGTMFLLHLFMELVMYSFLSAWIIKITIHSSLHLLPFLHKFYQENDNFCLSHSRHIKG
jgi:hypothetical protein